MTTLMAVPIEFPVKLFTITSNARLFTQSFVYLCGAQKIVCGELFGHRQNNNSTMFAFDFFFKLLITIFSELKLLLWIKNAQTHKHINGSRIFSKLLLIVSFFNTNYSDSTFAFRLATHLESVKIVNCRSFFSQIFRLNFLFFLFSFRLPQFLSMTDFTTNDDDENFSLS